MKLGGAKAGAGFLRRRHRSRDAGTRITFVAAYVMHAE
jgi:hypothetical protein